MKQKLVEFVNLTDEVHLSRQQLRHKLQVCLAETPAILCPWPTKLSLQSSPLRKAGLRLGQAVSTKMVNIQWCQATVLLPCIGLIEQLAKVAKRILMRVPSLQLRLAASTQRAWTRTLHWPEDYLDAALPLFSVRVGALEKWLCCALDRLPSSGEVGQAHPREAHRHETEAQDVLVFATAGAS